MASFPPSLTENTPALVSEYENRELFGIYEGIEVQMAALLVMGDLCSAKQLARRHPNAESLKLWIPVLEGMLQWNVANVWESLQCVAADTASCPLNTVYAEQVATAYRYSLTPPELLSTMNLAQSIPKYMTLLRMSQAECEHYLTVRSNEVEKNTHSSKDLPGLISFLESSTEFPRSPPQHAKENQQQKEA